MYPDVEVYQWFLEPIFLWKCGTTKLPNNYHTPGVDYFQRIVVLKVKILNISSCENTDAYVYIYGDWKNKMRDCVGSCLFFER